MRNKLIGFRRFHKNTNRIIAAENHKRRPARLLRAYPKSGYATFGRRVSGSFRLKGGNKPYERYSRSECANKSLNLKSRCKVFERFVSKTLHVILLKLRAKRVVSTRSAF